jgi:MFS family permease
MGISFGALTCYIGITTYAQIPAEYYGFGATVLGAGAILLPGCSLMSLLGFYTGHVVNKFGAKVVMICGLAGMVAIFSVWAAFHGSIWLFIFGMLWFACALMPVFSAGFTVTITQAPRDSVGIVGGLQQLTSSIGSSLGVAVFTACITAAVIPGTAIPAESGFTHAFMAGAIAAFIGFCLAWTIPRFVGRGEFDKTDEDPVREQPKPDLVRQPLPTGSRA